MEAACRNAFRDKMPPPRCSMMLTDDDTRCLVSRITGVHRPSDPELRVPKTYRAPARACTNSTPQILSTHDRSNWPLDEHVIHLVLFFSVFHTVVFLIGNDAVTCLVHISNAQSRAQSLSYVFGLKFVHTKYE